MWLLPMNKHYGFVVHATSLKMELYMYREEVAIITDTSAAGW
jgi:hypothetical protein